MKLSEIRNELKVSPKSAWYYIQGNIRFLLYRHKWGNYLLRKHIKEQFEWRLKQASKCYFGGQCMACGCKTPELFFADKACSASNPRFSGRVKMFNLTVCYPQMISAKAWKQLKVR